MAYAGEYVLRGLLWPEGIIDDTIDEEPRDWIELVLSRPQRQCASFARWHRENAGRARQ
jgi:hypothetical protein